jgi:hypothetical protein
MINELKKQQNEHQQSIWELWKKNNIHGINAVFTFARIALSEQPLKLEDILRKQLKKNDIKAYADILDECEYFLYRVWISQASQKDKYYFFRQFKKVYEQRLKLDLYYLNKVVFDQDEVAQKIITSIEHIRHYTD